MSECRRFTYTHDYTDDTTLTYTSTEDRSEIELTFTSEDPDIGTEILIYGSDQEVTMGCLMQELMDEIGAYLDDKETGINDPLYGEFYCGYTNTALYAFENILNELLRGGMNND